MVSILILGVNLVKLSLTIALLEKSTSAEIIHI